MQKHLLIWDVLPKKINCIEQLSGENEGKKNFTKVQFSWNFVQVWMNANVVIPGNMVVLLKPNLQIYDFNEVFFSILT